jgi:hypothetical protein
LGGAHRPTDIPRQRCLRVALVGKRSAHSREKIGLLLVAGHPRATERAVESYVDVEVPGVLVEVQERSGAPRERTPPALVQLREPAKLCQEWLRLIEVFLSRMPHLPSMTLSAQAPRGRDP